MVTNYYKQVFIKNLKAEMKAQKMTQKKLGEEIGVAQNTISQWVTGKNEPDINTLILMSYFLGVTPNDLLGWDEILNSDVSAKNMRRTWLDWQKTYDPNGEEERQEKRRRIEEKWSKPYDIDNKDK